jgi:hypothetical protein
MTILCGVFSGIGWEIPPRLYVTRDLQQAMAFAKDVPATAR